MNGWTSGRVNGSTPSIQTDACTHAFATTTAAAEGDAGGDAGAGQAAQWGEPGGAGPRASGQGDAAPDRGRAVSRVEDGVSVVWGLRMLISVCMILWGHGTPRTGRARTATSSSHQDQDQDQEQEQDRKHQLDVYVGSAPYPRPRQPVLMFVHGGLWVRGDRQHPSIPSLYDSVGAACAGGACGPIQTQSSSVESTVRSRGRRPSLHAWRIRPTPHA